MKDIVPAWENCCEKANHGANMSALELFVFNNEPAGKDETKQFREELAAVLLASRAPTDEQIDRVVEEETGFDIRDPGSLQPMTLDEIRRIVRAVLRLRHE